MSDPCSAKRLPTDLPNDPMHWVKAWLDQAVEQQVQRNPNTMTAATVGGDGQPHGRVVLCKQFVADPGYAVFYTNYRSAKARDLDSNKRIALVFHWDSYGRQARIEGEAVRSPPEESDAYFASRDWGSQLGAWGSDQSEPLESRAELIAQVGRRALRLGIDAAGSLKSIASDKRPVIPRPPHWGGYRVWARRVELWLEGVDRIHDRARWDRTLEQTGEHTFATGAWSGTRLQP